MDCVIWDFKRFGEDGRNKVVEQSLNLHGQIDGESCCMSEGHEGQVSSCALTHHWEFS